MCGLYRSALFRAKYPTNVPLWKATTLGYYIAWSTGTRARRELWLQHVATKREFMWR